MIVFLKTMPKFKIEIRNLPSGPATASALEVALVSTVTGASKSCNCFESFDTSRVFRIASWFIGGDWSCGVWFSFVWSPEVSIQGMLCIFLSISYDNTRVDL